MGYATADWPELERCLQQRRINLSEIDQALSYLSQPDPAGVIQDVSREDVARVAIHLNFLVTATIVIHSEQWDRIVHAVDTARAIYYHEIEEVRCLASMGIADLEALSRSGDIYWSAHSLASWMEARYWREWAWTEAESISAEAFLFGHPSRSVQELNRIRQILSDQWGAVPSFPGAILLRRARGFYRSKGLIR